MGAENAKTVYRLKFFFNDKCQCKLSGFQQEESNLVDDNIRPHLKSISETHAGDNNDPPALRILTILATMLTTSGHLLMCFNTIIRTTLGKHLQFLTVEHSVPCSISSETLQKWHVHLYPGPWRGCTLHTLQYSSYPYIFFGGCFCFREPVKVLQDFPNSRSLYSPSKIKMNKLTFQ